MEFIVSSQAKRWQFDRHFQWVGVVWGFKLGGGNW